MRQSPATSVAGNRPGRKASPVGSMDFIGAIEEATCIIESRRRSMVRYRQKKPPEIRSKALKRVLQRAMSLRQQRISWSNPGAQKSFLKRAKVSSILYETKQ